MSTPEAGFYGPLYGPAYFSAIISTAFYGIICVQSFFYFVHYQEDTPFLKAFVVILWVLNTIHQVLCTTGSYKYIRNGLTSQTGYLDPIPELVLSFLLTTLVSLPTQGFFIYRIYRLSHKNMIVPLLWIPLGIYQLVSTLVFQAKALYISNGLQAVELPTLGDPFFTGIITSYCFVTAGADILISTSLTYLLLHLQPRSVFKSTAKMVHRLALFAILSGTWTSIFAILTAVLVHVFHSNFMYMTFAIPLCSLYCNSFLANLNARVFLHRDSNSMHSVNVTDLLWMSNQKHSKRSVEPMDQGVRKTVEAATFLDAQPSTSTRVSVGDVLLAADA